MNEQLNEPLDKQVREQVSIHRSLLGAPFSAGARAASPVAVAYVGIGFAAGVVGAAGGMSAAEVGLLSTILFAGSAQFIFADLYTGAAVALVGTVFLVNLRHLLYSTAMTPRIRHLPFAPRVVIGAQLTDETFALSTSLTSSRIERASWMIGMNVTAWLCWIMGNVAGALTGTLAGAIEGLGIEFALAAMFAALLILQISGAPATRNRRIRTAAAVIAGILIVASETWWPNPLNLVLVTVVTASVAVAADFLLRPRREERTV